MKKRRIMSFSLALFMFCSCSFTSFAQSGAVEELSTAIEEITTENETEFYHDPLLDELATQESSTESTTEEEQTEVISGEPVCACGENAPENIAYHADSCARKQYVKTLFEGKTAEDIYSAWDNYSEALQLDLLNMLSVWDSTKYNELDSLINPVSTDSKDVTVGDTSIHVEGIPENVELESETVAPRTYHEDLFEIVGNKDVVFAIDITLSDENGEWQPVARQSVTVNLDASAMGLSDGERIGILHEHNGELNDLGISTVKDGKLTFVTNGFSVFYGYTVDFEYDGTWHSISGNSDIFLYELFAQLGIKRDTSTISKVEFSDPSLLTISKQVIDGYTGETDWHIKSLKPFDTKETLSVSFSDGTKLLINVYDATYTTLSNNLTLNNGDIINGATISGNVNITINGTVTIKNQISIPTGASLTITGSGTLKRDTAFLGRMFSVTGGKLTITGANITIDGSAVWSSSEVANSTREMLTVTTGATTTSAAIYIDSDGTVNLTSITMKNLYTTTKGNAPAIHSTGNTGTTGEANTAHCTLNATNITVENCATMSGQAIILANDCLATLDSCKFLNNHANGTYSGILKAGGPNYFSQIHLINCEANGNYSSGWGGVILWAANNVCNEKTSKAVIDGCTFTNNKARYLGGAISNEAIMEVKDTIIRDNIAMAGGGIATFPFTLTETQTAGGNACGLTLGSGNIIEGNLAFASGDFTPYSSTEAGANGDDFTIKNLITYTGGGGAVWCYMNKPGWTCSLDIGTGNELISNSANNFGGGVFVNNVASAGTSLHITGAHIAENSAHYGGGVAVEDATVTIESGRIDENTASINGGGIYVDNGDCIVYGTGSVSKNEAGNGGGIYILSGDLTINGGVVTHNSAVGTSTAATAKNATTGVGGGIYVKTGTFNMTGIAVGFHSNNASVAANDAYASGENTTLILPDVETMDLVGWTGEGKPAGWFADYMANDVNYPASIITDINGKNTVNSGRYDFYNENKVEVLYDTVIVTHTEPYYCLTIGTPHSGYGSLIITKELSTAALEDQAFIFEIDGTTRTPENDFFLTVTLVIKKGDTSAQITIANIPDGTYTVTEKDTWSWRYDQTAREFYPLNSDPINETTFVLNAYNPVWVADFTNTRTNPNWLSVDSYCENWWGGENGTKVVRKDSED